MTINHSDLLGYFQTNYPDELAAGDDGAIFAAMTAMAPEAKTGMVNRAFFAIWAASTGARAAIEDHATNPASPLRPSALALRDFLSGAADAFDCAHPTNAGLVAAWVAAGAISQADSDALFALAETPQTLAERDGFAGVDVIDIRRAIWNDDGTRRT